MFGLLKSILMSITSGICLFVAACLVINTICFIGWIVDKWREGLQNVKNRMDK